MSPLCQYLPGITTKGKTGISLTWEVDDAHLAADVRENQPFHDNDTSSLLTEIDDVIGPDDRRKFAWQRQMVQP